MADQWLYRVFGQEFGPISLEELRTLADIGILSAADEVRPESATGWAHAGTFRQLGLNGSTQVAVALDAYVVAPTKSNAIDEWYCQMLGQELGPLSFCDLVGYAEQGQVTAEDLVKLGANGKWRRVGTIGRLVAVLPFQAQPVPITPRPKTSTDAPNSTVPVTANVAPSVAVPSPPTPAQLAELQDAELALTKAEAACEPMIRVAQHHMSWASSPACDPAWWASINSVIEGPVPFTQLVDWAIAGKLRPIDYLCQGRFGQYMPAGLVLGLFPAANLLKTVSEALTAAESRVAAARAAIPAVASLPVAKIAQPASLSAGSADATKPAPSAVATDSSERGEVSNATQPRQSPSPAETTVSREQPTPSAPIPTETRLPLPSFGGSIARPIATSPAPRSRESSATIWEMITSSGRNLAIVAGVLTLLIGGWVYWSGGAAADVRRYYALKEILDEVHSLREKKSTNFAALKRKAVKVGSTTAKTLERQQSTRPSAKFLLKAARDELPRMIYGDLSVETPAEQKFVSQLSEAAKALGLKS